MKLDKATLIGKECGLENVAEYVNNIMIHCTSLFPYTEMEKELDELVDEAKAQGVQFHSCGLAMLDGKCYMCEKLNLALKTQDENKRFIMDGNERVPSGK